jgi:hypothetical protein
MIIVGVTLSTGISVSSISDGGGNSYTQIGTQTNPDGVTLEFWRSANFQCAASGTITVNLSGTGATAGVAVSYRGAIGLGTVGTATGNVNPIETGSQSSGKLGDFLIVGFGKTNGSNGYDIPTSGNLRRQRGSNVGAGFVFLGDNTGFPTTSLSTTSAVPGNWMARFFPLISSSIEGNLIGMDISSFNDETSW